MESWAILLAFGAGFVAARFGLPPLVGYLAAGFVLHGLGQESTEAVEAIADLGVLLLLFSIGLKLRPSTLARPEVFAVAISHLALTTTIVGLVLFGLGTAGLPLAAELDLTNALLVGFALSFSSTVFAVKALEQGNEFQALAGRLAIGILVMQDVAAVVWLALAAGDTPSPWVLVVVVGLVLIRPLLGWILDASGHGELVALLGLALALGVGATAFDAVGVKPDLGALLVGMAVAGHPKARELAQQILSFKDLLLVGFFLSIGLAGTPDAGSLAVAAVALVLVLPKVLAYTLLLLRFRLRARTALHTSLSLATHSEFGLIVMAAAVERGLVDPSWLSAVAVAVAVSFVIAALAGRSRFAIYERWSHVLKRSQRTPVHPEDAIVEPGEARIVVFGMGRIGVGAYDAFKARFGDVVLGVDRRDRTVEEHLAAGRRMVRGDALDRDFWERLRFHPGLELAVLAMNDHVANVEAARRVRELLPGIRIASAARYGDQVDELQRIGVDVARNFFAEAGQGLADDAALLLSDDEATGGWAPVG